MTMPTTVGLCPDPHCTDEFYMPNAKRGDLCPMEHGMKECPELVIFAQQHPSQLKDQP